ncbi:MAG: peptide-methionine (S)-S-oxide reductase MsrA [Bacteroidota bacterium]
MNHADQSSNLASATLGTGCFWCTEAIFDQLKGVHSVIPGYSGGHVEHPTYEAVCDKKTGHAEVIRVEYDPQQINFADLLDVFWQTHDPTTLNRQGNDVGPQYRSVIFYHDEQQKQIAEASLRQTDAGGLWPNPIVTEVSPLINFYKAEDYHQKYYERVGGRNAYCTYVVKPKVEKFEKQFKDRLKDGVR